jgi:hypothetical protein
MIERCEIIRRWQTGEKISPKLQDADVGNGGIMNVANLPTLYRFAILGSKIGKG